MLSTKNLVSNNKSVDSRWIFEYYCNLPERLVGQDIKIKSLFNPKDTNPSMSIFLSKENEYRFYDFSTGKHGDGLDLVMAIKNLDYRTAASTITRDYNDYVLKNGTEYIPGEFQEYSRYKVTNHKTRSWNVLDQKLWTEFNIGSSFLNEYCIRPLDHYIMEKNENGQTKTLTFRGPYLYGFFTKSGELYKIYQPKNKERKYIKVKNHIQGIEQLKGHDYLIIASGMKDIGSLDSLKLLIDYIAPDSENSMLPKELIAKLKKQYKYIMVLFDNDEAGIQAMKKYRETYNLPCILLNLSKDVAQSTKDFGPIKVARKLIPLIHYHTEKE
jgi:hypothetical protein